MKKFLALALAGTMLLGLAACDNGNAEEVTTDETTGSDETAAEGTESSTVSFDYSAGLDDNGFFEGVKASDIVTLPEYKGVEMSAELLVAAQSDVDYQIEGVLQNFAESTEVTDRAVVDGDTVNIDYVGSIDGVEFEGGNTGGQGTDVTIGVTNYIDDFLEQLIGHMPGETFNVEVTFPEDYGKDELNGKDAVFVTTINYVVEEVIPEFDDEVAKEYGFENTEAMVADIEAWVIRSQKSQFANEIIAAAACDNVPESVIKYFVDSEIAMIEEFVAAYGMTAEDYITAMGYESLEAYTEEMTETYKASAVTYLAAQAIAEIEGLTVTDDDIKTAGISDEEIATYGRPYIAQYVLATVVVPEFISQNATVVQ